MADGAARTRHDGAWIRRWGFWLGLIAILVAIVAILYPPDRGKDVGAVDTAPGPEAPTLPPRSQVPVFNAPEPSPSAMVAAASDSSEQREVPPKEPACKRAPIRGCAPSKDAAGCYHCARCWRPLHYDLAAGSKSFTFVCADMPAAPLYVELLDKTREDAGAVRWSVSASFDRQRDEQVVTPNLGGVFFSTFRGGDVEVTSSLETCGAGDACSGDVEISVNARRDDAR